MWDAFNKDYVKELTKAKDPPESEIKLPGWLEKYIEYKFYLLDRTGE